MIQLTIPAKFEDRFMLPLRHFQQCNPNIEFINIDASTNYVDWKIDCHPKLINTLFLLFRDLKEIYDIDFRFRFVYREKDLYTGTDSVTHYPIPWLLFDNSNFDLQHR